MTVQAPEAINYSSGRRVLTLSFPGEDPVELSAELLEFYHPRLKYRAMDQARKCCKLAKRSWYHRHSASRTLCGTA